MPHSSWDILYRNISLPVVLYGCETWSLTLREERKLRVSENGELRRICGFKRCEIRWEWRKLHELNDLYSSSNIRGNKPRRMRWVGHVARVTGELHRGFSWGNTRERVHLGILGVDGRIVLR